MSAASDQDSTRYYFISDLHIGGDETLQEVEFMDELLSFLRELAERDEDAELIVNGDMFGLWEFTELEGMEKFDALLERLLTRQATVQQSIPERTRIDGGEGPRLSPSNHATDDRIASDVDVERTWDADGDR